MLNNNKYNIKETNYSFKTNDKRIKNIFERDKINRVNDTKLHEINNTINNSLYLKNVNTRSECIKNTNFYNYEYLNKKIIEICDTKSTSKIKNTNYKCYSRNGSKSNLSIIPIDKSNTKYISNKSRNNSKSVKKCSWENCTFSPNISKYSKIIASKMEESNRRIPIHLKKQKNMEKKNSFNDKLYSISPVKYFNQLNNPKRLQSKLKLAFTKEEHSDFSKSSIINDLNNSYEKQINTSKKGRLNYNSNRLYDLAIIKANKLKANIEYNKKLKEEKEQGNFSYKPDININSLNIVNKKRLKSKSLDNNYIYTKNNNSKIKNFLIEQDEFKNKVQEKKNLIKIDYNNHINIECTFSPNLHKNNINEDEKFIKSNIKCINKYVKSRRDFLDYKNKENAKLSDKQRCFNLRVPSHKKIITNSNKYNNQDNSVNAYYKEYIVNKLLDKHNKFKNSRSVSAISNVSKKSNLNLFNNEKYKDTNSNIYKLKYFAPLYNNVCNNKNISNNIEKNTLSSINSVLSGYNHIKEQKRFNKVIKNVFTCNNINNKSRNTQYNSNNKNSLASKLNSKKEVFKTICNNKVNNSRKDLNVQDFFNNDYLNNKHIIDNFNLQFEENTSYIDTIKHKKEKNVVNFNLDNCKNIKSNININTDSLRTRDSDFTTDKFKKYKYNNTNSRLMYAIKNLKNASNLIS